MQSGRASGAGTAYGRVWTLPNVLTIFRILLTPVFILLFLQGGYWWALSIFTVAALTDGLDGFIAKRYAQISRLGEVLDPLADKALVVTSFLCLAARGFIPLWLAVMVITRDLIIVGGLFLVHFAGVDLSNRIHPTWISKCNTAAQLTLVVLVLVRVAGRTTFGWEGALEILVAVLTCLSCFQYVLKGVCLLRK
ncbi:MAG: CDP-diacylglycerol--glycerol-3-phosphate 3-phosphatidyltransferase [Desulfovibrio sp.]|uniref:CDP-diacylglycerol--glycerol-3-phosphate 3-phosphatidyltransferase n=1 Tax=Desulfovibrio sp. 7SRBS1 TaxID=3378064 RepID=UPI003B3C8D68